MQWGASSTVNVLQLTGAGLPLAGRPEYLKENGPGGERQPYSR